MAICDIEVKIDKLNKVFCTEDYVSKDRIRTKIMELAYEQEEGKNICENKWKIQILKELLGG